MIMRFAARDVVSRQFFLTILSFSSSCFFIFFYFLLLLLINAFIHSSICFVLYWIVTQIIPVLNSKCGIERSVVSNIQFLLTWCKHCPRLPKLLT